MLLVMFVYEQISNLRKKNKNLKATTYLQHKHMQTISKRIYLIVYFVACGSLTITSLYFL